MLFARKIKITGMDMLHVLALAWLIGIAWMGQSISVLPELSWPVMLLIAVIISLQLYAQFRLKNASLRLINATLAGILALNLGYSHAQQQLKPRLELRESTIQQKEVIVYVARLNQIKAEHIQQKVQVLGQHIQPVTWLTQTRLDDKGQAQIPVLKLGQYYRLSGEVRPAHSYAIAGVFDQEQWYLQQNIMANFRISTVQPVSPEQVAQQLGAHQWLHQSLLAKWRVHIEQQRLAVREFIAAQPLKHAGLLLALLTGDESLLAPSLEADFQRFGISHLLAISGPHVLIFAMLCCWLLQQIIRRYASHVYLKIPKIYLMLLPFWACVLLYSACVGFEIPALRTLLMVSVASVFILFKRAIRPLTLLLISASVLLIFDPFSVLSAAFWLSYLACFILLRIYQSLSVTTTATTFKERMQQGFWALCESQWKIFIALLPLMLIFFKQIAWIAPLSNLIAIPYLGLIVVPLDIIAGLAWLCFEPLGLLIWKINDKLLGILLGVFEQLDAGLQPQLIPIALNHSQLLALVLALVILFLPQGVLPKTWGILSLLPVFMFDPRHYPFELQVLDVGQGQAIFLRHQGQTLMIDVGGSFDEQRFSVGEQLIFPFLARQGVRQLDHVILTHLDQDHSGAYPRLANKMTVNHLTSNEQPEFASPDFSYCQAGQQWSWQQIQFRVLSPQPEALAHAAQQRNESSCVIHIATPTADGIRYFLLMGDAGWWTEYQILQRYPQLQVDVLVLGHHGSKHSSAYGFLQHYQPKLTIVSAGFANRYGHPSEAVQTRLDALNIVMLNTAQHGSLRFYLDQNTVLKLSLYRQNRLWLQRPLDIAHANWPHAVVPLEDLNYKDRAVLGSP